MFEHLTLNWTTAAIIFMAAVGIGVAAVIGRRRRLR